MMFIAGQNHGTGNGTAATHKLGAPTEFGWSLTAPNFEEPFRVMNLWAGRIHVR